VITDLKKQPGEYFDYEIKPDIGEAGTYFYHSHVGFQAVSAAGPLIVEETLNQAPPFPYDDERIVFLSELFNKTDSMIESELLRPFSVVRWSVAIHSIAGARQAGRNVRFNSC